MLAFNSVPINVIKVGTKEIACFEISNANIDNATVESFGEEWCKFNSFSKEDIAAIGNEYFDIIDNSIINSTSLVLDVGCGAGRWSMYFADKVKSIEAIDPSDAVLAAATLTKDKPNIRITKAVADKIPFSDNLFDLVISVGVLHHVPDTALALKQISQKAKIGGHVYVYIYYALDNRGLVFKSIFKSVNLLRQLISKMPPKLKKYACEVIAYTLYVPFITLATSLKYLFKSKSYWTKIPLNNYVDKPFYVVRNDALDRFGTPLEQRFSKSQIINMMQAAGLSQIKVSNQQPFWHAVGKRVI
jgi:ubiquinone/menaquinone biosynthesis C-methylase UbiE